MASLFKKGDTFEVAWVFYRVDSADYKTLNVLYHEGASIYAKMDAAAIKEFVNSDGTETNFSFDGQKGKVYLDEELIFKADAAAEVEEAVAKSNSYTRENGLNKGLYASISLALLFLIIGGYIWWR
ncbi:hypothetical protein PRVXH_001579 [Proteinivorax hydrogeniformans]|uniref:DUF4178 domain-containing protein n=1 Tax=Proteinivorax hydrogeniformans TaxID=1826727 RepID=A0AAU8HR83_9FIRM